MTEPTTRIQRQFPNSFAGAGQDGAVQGHVENRVEQMPAARPQGHPVPPPRRSEALRAAGLPGGGPLQPAGTCSLLFSQNVFSSLNSVKQHFVDGMTKSKLTEIPPPFRSTTP